MVDLIGQKADIIAFALLAEFAEIGKIAADLRGGDANRFSQLFRVDRGHVLFKERCERPQVDGETTYNDIGNGMTRLARIGSFVEKEIVHRWGHLTTSPCHA